jgi:hypothetical protein
LSRQPLGFVKERKLKVLGIINQENLKVEVVPKVPGSFT